MGYSPRQIDLIGHLQTELKHLKDELNAFKSGAKYQQMEASCEKKINELVRSHNRTVSKLRKDLADAHRETETVRRHFMEVNEDVLKEMADAVAKKDKEIEGYKATIVGLEQKNDNLMKENRKLTSEKVDLQKEIEELKEKADQLRKRLKKNSKNSSIPSSKESFRGKVCNGRVPSGKKPGGQVGHEGHRRPSLEANDVVELYPPKSIMDDMDWEPITGEKAYHSTKIADCILSISVTEVRAYGYRNKLTGETYYPELPGCGTLEFQYGDSIKALAFLMNNVLNVPTRKTSQFFEWASAGALGKGHPSSAWINGLAKEFAEKTEAEREEIFNQLISGDVMYTDMTTARINGVLKNIVVSTDKENVMYFVKDHKGFEGYKGTPVELFQGALCHDGDKTLMHFGSEDDHQLCNSHEIRYLQEAIESEPKMTWPKKTQDLLREGIHTRNSAEGHIVPEDVVQDIEKRFDDLMELAGREYNDNPPGLDRAAFNTYNRIKKGKDFLLYYLRHPEIDPTNNVSERYGRRFKSKLNVSGTFRSGKPARSEEANESATHFCEALGVIETAKNKGVNLYEYAKEIFGRVV